MDYVNLDFVIVVLFLLGTLVIGLLASGKVRSLRDYALGNGEFKSVVLFSTLSATVIGGYRIMGVSGGIYDSGLVYFLASLGIIVGFIFAILVVIPKLGDKFSKNLSIADIMGDFYGETSKKMTAFFGIANCIAVLCIQFVALGNILSSFLGIPFIYALLAPSLVLIIYSSFGGIRSVVMTDLIQFCIFIVMVPLLAKLCVDSNGGLIQIFQNIPPEKKAFFSHPEFFAFFFLFVSNALPFAILDPALTQRFLMLKPPFPSRPITLSFILVMILITLMTLLIPLALLSSHSDLEGNQAVMTAIELCLPVGLKGLMISGLLAAIMSTADSILNTSAVLAAQLFKLNKEKHMSRLKFTSICIASLALLFSINNFSLVSVMIVADIILIVFVSTPMFFAICGFKISKATYYTACFVSGSLLVILAMLKVSILYLPFIGMCCSIPILLSRQILNLRLKHFFFLNHQSLKNKILHYLGAIFNLFKLKENAFKEHESYFVAFSIFCILNFVFPLNNSNYLFDRPWDTKFCLYLVAILLCVSILLYRCFCEKSPKAFPYYCTITMLYCLPFMSTLIFLENTASNTAVINLIIAFILLSSFTNRFYFIASMLLGAICAILLETLIFGVNFNTLNNSILNIAYAMIFSGIIGYLFIQHRQIQQDERLKITRLLASSIAHELRSPLAALQMQSTMLEDIKQNSHQDNYKQYNQFNAYVYEYTAKSLQPIDMLLMAVKDELRAQDIGSHVISEAVKESISHYLVAHPARISQITIASDESEDYLFYGSKIFIEHIMLNLLDNAFKYGGDDVNVKITYKNLHLYVVDNGAGIQIKTVNRIFDRFFTTSETGTGVGLAFCANAMKIVGGSIKCDSKLGKYTKFDLSFLAG